MATRTRNGLLNVRLSPDSDRREDISAGPSRATSGLMRCSKQDRYSMTSSAMASSDGGRLSPSILAVSALMTSSNFDACITRQIRWQATMKLVGKPDAGNRHVRFDERGRKRSVATWPKPPRLSSTLLLPTAK
jgi:hypothetical protein